MNIITIEENEKKLRNKCIPIMKEKSDYMNNLINSMNQLMINNNGCGITAPQVGVNKRLFVAVLDNEKIELFVNPTILEHSEGTEIGTEGCLSVPKMCGEVERYKKIKVRYFNGKEIVTEEYEGMNARIIQHEYDHLNGVLYIDKAENIRKVQLDKMTVKEQIADCFQTCRELGDSYRIKVDDTYSLFILVQENSDYEDGRLEYFIELNKDANGADEPCAKYNISCSLDSLEDFEMEIMEYIGNNGVCFNENFKEID